MPIGNAQMKRGKKPLDLWELLLFPTLLLFFTVVSFKEYSWLKVSLHCTVCPSSFLGEKRKNDK